MSPTRECYLRVVQIREGVEYIAGLELRADDDLGKLRTLVKTRMKVATTNILPGRWKDSAHAIEKSLATHWADRAYFIEVGNDRDGWVQIFDPKGYVRRAG